MSFGDVVDAWLREASERRLEDDPAQLHLCPNTRDRYSRSVAMFLRPYFKDMRANRITATHVRKWREGLVAAGYAHSTINGHHRVLKTVLATVDNNAATQVAALNEKVGARITRKQPNLLDAEDLDRFLEVAKERWPQHYALILVLFTTTMRVSTALALRWEDLDYDTMEFVVRRRLSGSGRHAEIVRGVKRDRHGEDTPPLLPGVLDALEQHRVGFNGAQRASDLVFPSARTGGHQSRSVLAKPFMDILKHAGITKRFTPHGCRRTGAKLYGRTSGMRMAMSIAGHMTESMHERYAPLDAKEKQVAAQRAFGTLRLLRGGLTRSYDETGRRTGTPEVSATRRSAKVP